jgi:hypothetical protein
MSSPWLTLRQAREALRAGQPDEARRLCLPLAEAGYRRAIRLSRDIARVYADRGDRHLRADQPHAAWRELLAAEAVNASDRNVVRLRQTLTRLGLAECRAALEAGHPDRAVGVVAELRDRGAESSELDTLSTTTVEWLEAAGQADRGDFPEAKGTANRLADRLDPATAAGVARFLADLDRRHKQFQEARVRLRAAADGRRWEDAVRWADEVVAVAPNHAEARRFRAKAWDTVADADGFVPLELAAETAADPPADDGRPLPKRFRLWVDGVGGYLVCLSPRVTLGQATTDGPVDVPLFADVSRLHAELTRDAEGYVLESAREVQVNGRPVKRMTLSNGDRITLGSTCQFVFRKPVPVSPTAKLELVSGHRLPQAVDGVLLMAEALVMGREGKAHVVLPDEVPAAVSLYRAKDGLGVRFDGAFTVDGRPCKGRSPLPVPSVVSADSFSFAVEPVGLRT